VEINISLDMFVVLTPIQMARSVARGLVDLVVQGARSRTDTLSDRLGQGAPYL
jgi:hypothetical protein